MVQVTNKNPYLSIIIPAYNESERIPMTLLDIDRQLEHKNFTYEILVVNDGSVDNTAEVVTRMAKTIRNLQLIDNKENKGKGGVVRQGMLEASGEIRLFTDADNSTSIDHFFNMQKWFERDYDVVICSRAHKKSHLEPPQPWYRQIPGKIGNLIIQALLLPGFWDTQCGFKAFTAQAAERVFAHTKIGGWGFDIEALVIARKLGFKIKTIPVTWVNDLNSHVGAGAYLKVLKETLTIRLWLWLGKYNFPAEPTSERPGKKQ